MGGCGGGGGTGGKQGRLEKVPTKRTKRRTTKCERVEQSVKKKKKIHVNMSSFSCSIHKLMLLMRNHIKKEGRGEDGCIAVVSPSTREPVWCVEHSDQLSSLLSPLSPGHPSPLSTDCNSSLLNKKKKKSRPLICPKCPTHPSSGLPGPRGKH